MSKSLSIQHLLTVLALLEDFQSYNNSLFNLTRLFEIFHLSNEDLEKALEIILRFQTFFSKLNNKFTIVRIWNNNQIYLKLVPKSEKSTNDSQYQKIIELSTQHSQLLNDIIYIFNYVNIGKGFNLKVNSSELIKKVKELKRNHPYFFEYRGNGNIYPTKLASQLGNMIRKYERGNRKIQDIKIDEYQIKVKSKDA